MRLSELLRPALVKTDIESEDKERLFEEMVQLLCAEGLIQNRDAALAALYEREAQMSTGIGNGLALPHGRINEAHGLLIAIGISRRGIEYGSLDGAPVHVIVLILAEAGRPGPHVEALAEISRRCAVPGFLTALRAARSSAEIIDLIRQGE